MALQEKARLTAVIISVYLLLWPVYSPCLAQPPSDSEMSASSPTKGSCCSACYQGPAGPAGTAGVPGIPGVPGNNGLQGVTGQKGEPGLGLLGAKGVIGDHGQKGDQGEPGIQGVGLPGKIGPPLGPGGQQGGRGEPGESTYVTPTPPSVVAFSARLHGDFTGNTDDVVIFNRVWVNIGEGYDFQTGVFSCSLPGVYFFTVTIMGLSSGPRPFARLEVNGEYIFYVRDNHGGFNHQCSNSAILVLASGDRVYLETVSSGKSIDGGYDATFSGFLIHPM